MACCTGRFVAPFHCLAQSLEIQLEAITTNLSVVPIDVAKSVHLRATPPRPSLPLHVRDNGTLLYTVRCFRYVNTSIHQYINTSIRQHLNPLLVFDLSVASISKPKCAVLLNMDISMTVFLFKNPSQTASADCSVPFRRGSIISPECDPPPFKICFMKLL